MLVDPTLYAWLPNPPEEYALETEGIISFGDEARRVYQIEIAGVSEGTVSIYADDEKTELIGTVTAPDVLIEPASPVCTDSLVTEGDGIGAGVTLNLFSEKGLIKAGLEPVGVEAQKILRQRAGHPFDLLHQPVLPRPAQAVRPAKEAQRAGGQGVFAA